MTQSQGSIRRSLEPLLSRISLAKQMLSGYPRERRKFYSKHGYEANLAAPGTFNEKLLWKKIHDRNPLLPVTADKYRVRQYITEKLGPDMAQEILIPLLHVSRHPDDIPFEKLPENYVAKANHGSGWNVLVRENSPSPAEVKTLVKKWLSEIYSISKLEWAYRNIPRCVVFESFLMDESGKVPKDYKFFMIHGKCRMVQVDSDRFEHHTRTLYTADWEKIDVGYKFPVGPDIPRPEELGRMLLIAERLSEDFGFVRVDLYAIGKQVYFGEMTHYPESGMGKFTARDFDIELGKYWDISRP